MTTTRPHKELTDDEIMALAHRKATTYTHRSDPTSHGYGFVKHTMLDFARAIEAAVQPVPPPTHTAPHYLGIERAQGLPRFEDFPAPVLYTDSINGCMVFRDDVWLAFTSQLAQPVQPSQALGPLTQQQVVDGFCSTPYDVQYVSTFNAGVRFAEQAHGVAAINAKGVV